MIVNIFTKNLTFLKMSEIFLSSYLVEIEHILSLGDYIKSNDTIAIIVDTYLRSHEELDLVTIHSKMLHIPLIIVNTQKVKLYHFFDQKWLIDPFLNWGKQLRTLMSNTVLPSGINIAPELSFNIGRQCIQSPNDEIMLTSQEFKILYFLCIHPNQIIPAEKLIHYADLTTRSSLYVLIKSIREKIEKDPNDPQILITKHGIGYKLNLTHNNVIST